MNPSMSTEQILAHSISSINSLERKETQQPVKKHSARTTPFIKAGNVTGIALEFFTGQMANRLIPRAAADFLAKICNVAASTDAYQIYYSKSTMAERAGVSQKSVQRYMRAIEASGIMTRTAVTDSIRGHQPNVYTFTPCFLSAVKGFFTEQLNAGQLKNLRAVAQRELSGLVDSAISAFASGMKKVRTLRAVKAFLSTPPRGHIDPPPTGQCDPQEVVVSSEVVSQNPAPQDSPALPVEEIQTITGQERRVMTRDAIIRTRAVREREKAIALREAFTRRQRAEFLLMRNSRQAKNESQDTRVGHNHARIEEEGRKHDEAMALAAANAQKDPAAVNAHIAKIRAMFSSRR